LAQRPTPVLEVNAGLTLAAGDTTPISAAQLRLGGGEPVLLEAMLLSAPLQGALIRDGFALTGGDIFTQEDINENRLHYRHDGETQQSDRFIFATPDGEVPPTVFAISIELMPVEREPDGNDTRSTTADDALGESRNLINEPASARTTLVPPKFEPGPACPWVGAPTVAELLGEGLAVVRIAGEGKWQFSLDDGRTWRDFGAVYHGRARLLRAGDRVRFRPQRGAMGPLILAGRPWDGSVGEPGDTVSLAGRGSHGEGTAFGANVRTRRWEQEEG
jgi:hypothetical protein